jgi:hypothetical protein
MNDQPGTKPTTSAPTQAERINRLRDELLEGWAFPEEIAEAIGRSVRTVERMNLPFKRLGARRIHRIADARAVLLDEGDEGDLPPAVRHRLRMERPPPEAA